MLISNSLYDRARSAPILLPPAPSTCKASLCCAECATGDLSTNNWVMGLLAGGESWHNNHHAFQWSSRHGLQWWEFDATYCLIRLLEAVGLAWDVQVPTKQQMAVKRLRKQRGQAAARG